MADYNILFGGRQGPNFLQNAQAAQGIRANNMLLQQEQQAMQREQQFNSLLGDYLGQNTVNTLTGQGGAVPGVAPAPPQAGYMNQLYALDPERAMQVQQFQQQQAAIAEAKQIDDAKRAVLKAQYVFQSQDPGALVKTGMPEVWQQIVDAGGDPESFTPEQWQKEAQDIIAYYGPIAGVGPAGEGEQFTLSQGQTRFDKQGRPIASVAPEEKDKDPTDKLFQRGTALRKEYESKKENFETIRSAYANVENAEDGDAGDTQLVTNFMRVIAPGIRVQPGTELDSANLPQNAQAGAALWNKFVNDGKLSPKERASIRSQAKRTYETQERLANELRPRYTELSEDAGIEPWKVIGRESAVSPKSNSADTDMSKLSDEELRRIAAGG